MDYFRINRRDDAREQEELVKYYMLASKYLRRSKKKGENVAMPWTDCKKVNDMVLQTWIIEFLKNEQIIYSTNR